LDQKTVCLKACLPALKPNLLMVWSAGRMDGIPILKVWSAVPMDGIPTLMVLKSVLMDVILIPKVCSADRTDEQ
jgi:hypothetical protein